jgi:catechol 2,3-dioxygenase-like lactoylglutathione lyase family enzyme
VSLDITAVDHVQIAVPRAREAEALHFYRAILGLKEIPKPRELRARGGAWFQVGNLQMHVGIDEHESPKSKRHVCFLVPDLKRARDAIARAGVAVEEESVAEGLSRFFVRDPAGNRIEIGHRD